MRKAFIVVAFFLTALSGQAQEKVMNILKTDGTNSQTRVADFKQISFYNANNDGQGLLVKTLGGESAAVLFKSNPVVTILNGKLVVSPTSAEAVEVEIPDIAEISFGKVSDAAAINSLKGLEYELQEHGALFRGIPNGVKPRIYSIDGRSLRTPSVSNGELLLNRTTLGTGIFIVKVGTFSTKIKL